MKTKGLISTLIFVIIACSPSLQAQLRSQLGDPHVPQAVVQGSSAFSLSDLIDPSRFSMSHSFSLSYMTFGGQNMSLGSYTNSMRYQISDPLSVRMDVSMLYSPMSSLGKGFQNSINGLYIDRAEINYNPSNNFHLQLQYRQVPAALYMNPYSNPWGYGEYRPWGF